ncbi:hypothetical protein NIES4102_21790 [Chondrocystis sp. NIES-4102]|nr:hypothetical protein NIES4102_21790 [Chondrocystis sp. NIES-4102]
MFSKKNQLIILYFCITLATVTLYSFDPADSDNFYPPSLSRTWGGFYCIGCGGFRSLHQLLHGNWQSALELNPLLIISLPYFIYWILPSFLRYFYNINLYTIQHKNKQIIIIISVCLLYGLLRNIPIPIFYWLIPPS